MSIETLTLVMISGLTLGAMYALSAVGLSLIWGALGMLNMAHGALLAIGGYACFAAISYLDLPIFLGIPIAILVSGIVGLLLYLVIVRYMYRHPSFETNIIIATIGLAILLENVTLKMFGAYPFKQPFSIDGGVYIGPIFLAFNNLAILIMSAVLVIAVSFMLNGSRMGRAIRATAINRDAAQLMGVPVGRVFAQVMAISGGLAAVSGVMLSSVTTLSPTMGYDPMIKAFIICATAGLGNVYGAFYAALVLGMFEAVMQFSFGVRFAFPAMLLLVIAALIWRPYGVFGQKNVTRV